MSGEKSTEDKTLREKIINLWVSTSPRDQATVSSYLKCRIELSHLDNQQIWEVMELLQQYMQEREGG